MKYLVILQNRNYFQVKFFSYCLSSDWSRPWKIFWIYYMYSDFFALTFSFFEKVLILSYDSQLLTFTFTFLYSHLTLFLHFQRVENVHLLVSHFTSTQTLSSLVSSATITPNNDHYSFLCSSHFFLIWSFFSANKHI